MPAIRPVTVDLATGVVTIGGTRVTLDRDATYFTAPDGFRARALTFAERSSIVAGALIDPEPNRSLLTKLRSLAAPSHDTATEMSDALMLALAGGGEPAAPFPDCSREACRRQGTDWQTVQQTPAVLVDQIASRDDSADAEAGWTRFEFREAPQDSISVEDCCRLMLEQLLERGTPREESTGETANAASVEDCCGLLPEQLLERGTPREESTGETANAASEWSCAVSKFGDLQSAPDGNSPSRQLTDNIPLRSVAARPRAAQSPRVRAVLPSTDGVSRSPVNAQEKPASIGGTLRSILDWRKESWPQTVQAEPGSPGDFSHHASVPVLDKHTDDRPFAPSLTNKSTTTLRDIVTVSTAALASAAVAAAPIMPNATAVPAKARLRAHRLRDMPPRSAKTVRAPALAGPSALSAVVLTPTTSEPVVASTERTTTQRDWIHEIATALADECDLRGLDT